MKMPYRRGPSGPVERKRERLAWTIVVLFPHPRWGDPSLSGLLQSRDDHHVRAELYHATCPVEQAGTCLLGR